MFFESDATNLVFHALYHAASVWWTNWTAFQNQNILYSEMYVVRAPK